MSLPTAAFDTSVPIATVIIVPVVTTNIDPLLNYIGFQGDFTFDSSVVTFAATAIQAAGLTANGWNLSAGILPGPGPIKTLRLSGISQSFTPLTGSGTLFNLRMLRVSSTPGSASPLVWSAPPNNFVFVDADLNTFASGQSNGLITITAPAPTPTPTPIQISGTISYCSNPGPAPVSNVVLNLTGSGSASTLSDNSGNYTFSSLVAGGSYTITPSKAALPPGSSGIDTLDVLTTQLQFFRPSLSGCRLTAADVDGDAVVDTVDVIAIQRFYLGLSTGIANVGKYQFSPANRTYPGVGSDQTGQNYDTLVFGDVASGFVHLPEGLPKNATGENMSSGKLPATVATLSLPNLAVDAFVTDFVAQVTTKTVDARNKLVGFQGDFNFDERVVTFQSPPVSNGGLTGGGNWNVSGNVLPGAGPMKTLRVSAYSNNFTPLSGSGTLFELRMIRVSKTARGTQLIWAVPPNNFIFIDADLKTQEPGSAAPGSITTSEKHR